jgi:hypothetical protein
MNMKKIIYSLFVCAVALSAVSCMEIDNWDAPEARFSGRIIDKNTGEPILADQGEYKVRIYEMSFSTNPDPFDIPVKQDGSFNNHRIFAGTYDVFLEGAWWPLDRVTGIPVGKNTKPVDFEVIPYYTVENFETELDVTDAENPLLTLSCRVGVSVDDASIPEIEEILAMLSLNSFCGASNKIGNPYNSAYAGRMVLNDEGEEVFETISKRTKWSAIEKEADGKSIEYWSTVPVKPGYTYFVRMGVKSNTVPAYYNYSEIVKIEVPQL